MSASIGTLYNQNVWNVVKIMLRNRKRCWKDSSRKQFKKIERSIILARSAPLLVEHFVKYDTRRDAQIERIAGSDHRDMYQ